MEIPLPEETTIRDYLLGRLDPASEVVERIDELMLNSIEFSEGLGVVEDDIIEEYLEGTLSPSDKQSVETHFLRPAERQRKLQNARLLTRRLASADAAEGNKLLQIRPFSHPVAPVSHRSNFRVYAEIAAALLFAASVIYLYQSRHRLQSALGESDQQLTQEREHSVQLNQQLQSARDLAQPSVAMLSLFQPGIQRSGDASVSNLKIGPGTSRVHVELALTSSNPGPLNLRLEFSGKTVWSLGHLTPFTSRDGSVLIFEIPAAALAAGENQLIISQASVPPTTYLFTVSKP
jgi:hypothetical protein